MQDNVQMGGGGLIIMYIPEFWCGVIATVGAEFLSLLVYSIFNSVKKGNKK